MAKLHLGFGLVAAGLIVWACSTGDDPTIINTNSGTGGTGSGLGNTSTTSSGGGLGTATDSNGSTIVFRRDPVCDAAGANCKCTTFASFGATATYGSGSDSTTDFNLWLTEKSNLAAVDFYKTDTPITAELLAKYDVILLQDLRAWQLDATELGLFQQWINGGGGVIALSGYYSDTSDEITPTNNLLSTTGVSLLAAEVPGQTCVTAESVAVCSNPNSNNAPKCYCWGVSIPLTEWTTTHAIAANIKAVGSFRGRAVSPGDGEVVVSYQGTAVGVTKTYGSGKVFVFGDEWVTYTSQWGDYTTQAAALTAKYAADPTSVAYESCWDTTTNTACTSRNVFQTMQFWYNSILYVAPPSQCTFTIDEPDDIIY